MDPADFTDGVREDNRTELSRLGSSKALYALTEGEMEEPVIRAGAGDLFHYAAERFDAWAGDAAGPADLFAEAAALVRDHHETAVGDLADYEPGAEPAVDAVLADYDEPGPRLGALVAWTLVAGETAGQLTGYFTGQADPQTASTFREVGGDLDDLRDQALEAVADRDDAAPAREAADEVIETAYDEYFDTLESLGVNPKPVC